MSRKTKKKPSRSAFAEEFAEGKACAEEAICRGPLTVDDLVRAAPFKAKSLTGEQGMRRIIRSHRPVAIKFPAEGRGRRGEGRVHCLGRKAVTYLRSLSAKKQREAAELLCRVDAAAIVTSPVPAVPEALLSAAREKELPVLVSALPQSHWKAALKTFFEQRSCPEIAIHGVLVEVSGVGLLILGPSGIGKSESALDLVTRGHRLIADDLIRITRMPEGRLLGSGSDHGGSHMEIRGLGIINIQDLFGVAAVLESKDVELVVDLRDWESLRDCDRLGIEEEYYEVLGVKLPYLRIPVTHGRNMAVILEVAARNHLLKKQGRHTAREFESALSTRLSRDGE